MLGQQQLQQGQAQLQQQDIQQGAIKLQDTQAMSAAMHEWDGKDMNDLPGLILKHNGSANAVLGMKNSILDYQTKLQALTKDQIANEKTKNDYFAQAIDNVKSLPPDQQPAAFEGAKADAVKRGYLDPQAAQGLAYQGPDQLDLLEKSLVGHSAAVEQAAKSAETQKSVAQAGEATTAAAKNLAEMQGLTGPFAEAKYRNVLSAIIAGKPVSDDDLTFAKGYEAENKKSTTQSDTLGVTSTNVSGPAGLAAVGNRRGGRFVPPNAGAPQQQGQTQEAAPPAQNVKQSIVDLIGQYKMNPQLLSRMMYKHPEMVGLVEQKYPDWDQTSYEAKNKIVQSYTSGPESRSINAISTALGHAGELGQAIDALGNSNGLNMLRSLGNKIGVSALGNDKVTMFNTIVHRLGPEITQAYVQGGGGEGERAANEADFSASLGDKQLRGNLGETIKLLRSKIAAQEQQWNNTYKPTRPEDDFSTRFLTPGAKDALQRYSPQSTAANASHVAGGPSQGLPEGATGKGSDGKSYVVKGGKWVPAQ